MSLKRGSSKATISANIRRCPDSFRVLLHQTQQEYRDMMARREAARSTVAARDAEITHLTRLIASLEARCPHAGEVA